MEYTVTADLFERSRRPEIIMAVVRLGFENYYSCERAYPPKFPNEGLQGSRFSLQRLSGSSGANPQYRMPYRPNQVIEEYFNPNRQC